MSKFFKIIFLIALVAVLILSFFFFEENNLNNQLTTPREKKTKIALIFDDLGESLQSLHQIYELKVPVTISVIPGLRFSKNIAHIGARAGFSVMIHLPLEPEETDYYSSDKYDFISGSLPKNQIDRLLNNYLNSIRIAIGVNNHMGSKATQDRKLMSHILRRINRRNLIFIDSRTSPNSVAYAVAKEKGMKAGYAHACLEMNADPKKMKEELDRIIAENPGKKLILIAHPQKNTFEFLKDNLTRLKEKVEFITIEEYFDPAMN